MNLATLPTLVEYNNFKTTVFRNIDAQNQTFLVGGTRIGSTKWYWFPSGTDLIYSLDWDVGANKNPSVEQCLSFVGRNFVLKWDDVICDSANIRFVCEKFL
jgi:hypothetical protein